VTSPRPLLVYLGLPAHLRSDVTRKADLYVCPGEVGIQVKRWLVSRPEDGVIVRQREGRVQLNVCRFPPKVSDENPGHHRRRGRHRLGPSACVLAGLLLCLLG